MITITSSGLATGVAAGTVTITATDLATGLNGTATLGVILATPIAVPSLSQWGLVGMAGLFAVLVLLGMRRQARARRKAGYHSWDPS